MSPFRPPAGNGTIKTITSADGSAIIIDPNGPSTDISVAVDVSKYLPLAGGTMTGPIVGFEDKGGQVFNVKAYGATGNAVNNIVGDGNITSGSASFSSASGVFSSSDVGKTILVEGAGTSGVVLTTTIATFVSATSITLAAAAATTVTTAQYTYGTDDTTAIQDAINSASTVGGGIVFAPTGNFLHGGLTYKTLVTIQGAGKNATIFTHSGTGDGFSSGLSSNSWVPFLGWSDLTLTTGPNTAASGVHLWNAHDNYLTRINFEGNYTSAVILDASAIEGDNAVFNCVRIEAGYSGHVITNGVTVVAATQTNSVTWVAGIISVAGSGGACVNVQGNLLNWNSLNCAYLASSGLYAFKVGATGNAGSVNIVDGYIEGGMLYFIEIATGGYMPDIIISSLANSNTLTALATGDLTNYNFVLIEAGSVTGSHVAPVPASASGILGANYSLTTTLATYLTTASLGVGTWLVTHVALVQPGTAAVGVVQVNLGTATAALAGVTSGQVNNPSGSVDPIVLSFIVTVTVAGTLVFQGSSTTATGIILASASYGGTTGYTAVKIG